MPCSRRCISKGVSSDADGRVAINLLPTLVSLAEELGQWAIDRVISTPGGSACNCRAIDKVEGPNSPLDAET